MKKLVYIFTAVAVLLSMACCTDDDIVIKTKSPKIAISLVSEVPATVYPGENIDFEFSLSYSKGLKSAYALVDGAVLEGSNVDFAGSPESGSIKFSYMAKDIYAGNSVDIAVVASAADGASGHYDVPVFVLAAKSNIVIALPDDAPEEFEVDGSTLEMDITITSANVDMKSLATYKGDTQMPEMTYDFDGDLRNHTLKFKYTPTMGDTGNSTVFMFEVMDVNGNIVNAYYSVKFFKAASDELDERFGIVMGMNKCVAAGQFFNTYEGIVYEANGVGAQCANVDIVLFWSNNAGTNGAAFASPNVQNVTSIYPEATIVNTLGGTQDDIPLNWKVRNETTYRELDIDADTFASLNTLDEVIELYENGAKPANEHVTFQKKAGSTIAFCSNRYLIDESTGEPATDSEGNKIIDCSKYGVIRVTAAPGNNTGSLTFDYKIEK